MPTLPDPLVSSRPDYMSGTPCFHGTRVPVKNLFDYLAATRSTAFWSSFRVSIGITPLPFWRKQARTSLLLLRPRECGYSSTSSYL